MIEVLEAANCLAWWSFTYVEGHPLASPPPLSVRRDVSTFVKASNLNCDRKPNCKRYLD